jgi:threonyl-tRNA synthetase
MKLLLNHADYIEYEPISKEIAEAEKAKKEKSRIDELVVVFIAMESDDDLSAVKRAAGELDSSVKKLGVKRVLLYPYAHLSQDLAPPRKALELIKQLEMQVAALGYEVYRAPFGWNKAFEIRVKGHPYAEQSKSIGPESKPSKKERTVAISAAKEQHLSESAMLARVRKSEFVGLPETDHRVIGERLDLFSFQELSPGMVYWHDKGLTLRNLLIDFIRNEQKRRGYIEISTPALANTILWRISGHWDHYKDTMFFTQMGDEQFGLKPMNCPSTFLFYKTRRWSYRDLPLRVADFDPLFRNELSGVASGMFRVKTFIQDDAHIFVAEQQIVDELRNVIDLMSYFYSIFGLNYSPKISTMPDQHLGTKEQWDAAVSALVEAVRSKGIEPVMKEKEGAFYGPKIDVDVKDSMGREWQCATIQLDFQMPRRFRLTFTGSDGQEHTPVVIHRVIYGSLERFIGILIEHYQGRFPTWISPVQARVIPVSDQFREYCDKVYKVLTDHRVRTDTDYDSSTLGSKIRKAQLEKIPYMLVIGKKEADSNTVSIRRPNGETIQGLTTEELLSRIAEDVAAFR